MAHCLPVVGVILSGCVCDGTLLTCGGCDIVRGRCVIVRGMCVPTHCLPAVAFLLAGPGDTDGSLPQHGQVPQPAEQRAHPAPCGQFPSALVFPNIEQKESREIPTFVGSCIPVQLGIPTFMAPCCVLVDQGIPAFVAPCCIVALKPLLLRSVFIELGQTGHQHCNGRGANWPPTL